MREAVRRAILGADLICLHLDPAYAIAAEGIRILVSRREAFRIARMAERSGGVRMTWEGERLILAPPTRLNGEARV